MELETVIFEIGNGVAKVILNRPDMLNSLNEQMLKDLLWVADECERNDTIKAVLVTGSGRAFCAGADLGNIPLDNSPEARAATGKIVKEQMDELFNPVLSKFAQLNKPVVNAINGMAAGGGVGFSVAGDINIAAESAKFKQVFIPQLGIIPDLGSTWFLPRLIGRAKAMGLALLGDTIDAQEAERLGLIWKVYPDDLLLEEAHKLAQKLADGPSFGIAKLKEAFQVSEHNSLDEQLAHEANTQLECCASEDFVEGVTAFMQKRKPDFKGC